MISRDGLPWTAPCPQTSGHAARTGQRSLLSVVADPVLGMRDYPAYVALSLASAATILYLAVEWISVADWRQHPFMLATITLLAAGLLATNQFRWWLLPLMRRPRPMAIRTPWRVGVVTTFVPSCEPLDMLENVVRALTALDYSHDTWVLDEEGDFRVQELCWRLGALYFSRRDLPHYQAADGEFKKRSKHGNYNAWLADIGFGRYDIVAAFDPDHVAEPRFLTAILGYFEDPGVAYVQVAQAYRNQAESWVARGAAEETYDYFSTIQMASYRLGYPIIVGGHNAHRASALREIGGFAAHDADDLLATMRYQAAGWQGVYEPQIMAQGPDTRRLEFVHDAAASLGAIGAGHQVSRVPAPQRRSARFDSHDQLTARPQLLGQGIASRAGSRAAGRHVRRRTTPAAASRSAVPLACLIIVLGASEFYRQRFFLDPASERGVHWRATVLRWAKWPQMLLALVDVALNRRPAYSITAKTKDPVLRLRWLWPHIIAAALVVAAWCIGCAGRPVSPGLHIAVLAVVVATAALALSALSLGAASRETTERRGQS